MAGKKFLKDSEEYVMFMDYWQLCQNFWEPEQSDNYWEELCKALDAFCKKYGNTGLAREISLAFINFAEKKNNENCGYRIVKKKK